MARKTCDMKDSRCLSGESIHFISLSDSIFLIQDECIQRWPHIGSWPGRNSGFDVSQWHIKVKFRLLCENWGEFRKRKILLILIFALLSVYMFWFYTTVCPRAVVLFLQIYILCLLRLIKLQKKVQMSMCFIKKRKWYSICLAFTSIHPSFIFFCLHWSHGSMILTLRENTCSGNSNFLMYWITKKKQNENMYIWKLKERCQ